MVPASYVRSELIYAIREATRGLGDAYVVALKAMPDLRERGSRDVWVYALGGADGTGGVIGDARVSMTRAGTREASDAWARAYDLARCLRNYLVSLPEEKASCEACEAFGCSACDQSGMTFDQPEAA